MRVEGRGASSALTNGLWITAQGQMIQTQIPREQTLKKEGR
jgi:hypothetical protein